VNPLFLSKFPAYLNSFIVIFNQDACKLIEGGLNNAGGFQKEQKRAANWSLP